MDLGVWGEKTAAKFLEKKGYEIMDHNFRFGKTELDLVAKKEDVIAFVEVKTRRNLYYGNPNEAITPTKKQHIKKVSAYYVATKNLSNMDLRMDVIEILRMGKKTYLRHIENAF